MLDAGWIPSSPLPIPQTNRRSFLGSEVEGLWSSAAYEDAAYEP